MNGNLDLDVYYWQFLHFDKYIMVIIIDTKVRVSPPHNMIFLVFL